MHRRWRWLAAVSLTAAMLGISQGGVGAQALPGKPTITQVTPGSSQVTVFWDAPDNTGGAAVTSYDLRWIASDAEDKSDANWTVLDDFWTSGALSGVVSGLANGSGYDIAMRASTSNGDGAWSAATAAMPRDAAPTITALVAGEKAFTVAWTAPEEVAAGEDVNFDIRWIRSDASDKSDARWQSWRAPQPGRGWEIVRDEVRSFRRYYVSNDVGYDVQVRAATDHDSAWSATSKVTPGEAPDSISQDMSDTVLGVPVAGHLGSHTDVDYFEFVLGEPATVMFRTTGNAFNTVCELRDDQNGKIDTDDNSELPNDAKHCLIVEPLEAGTHYVTVQGAPTGAESQRFRGPYALHSQVVDEPGDTASEAVSIAFGEIKGGELPQGADVDFVSVRGGAADQYVTVAIRSEKLSYFLRATLLDGDGNKLGAGVAIEFCHPFFRGQCAESGLDVQFKLPANTDRFIKIEPRHGQPGEYAFTLLRDTAYQKLVDRCTALGRPQGWQDPLSGCQWHLSNEGQLGGRVGEDANVAAAHAAGHLGEGVSVAIVDSGVDVSHEDLAANASAARAHSFCRGDDDLFALNTDHGTSTAGVVAARDNAIGMRGVAPRVQIYSSRLFGCAHGPTSYSDEANAITRNVADVAVSINNWNYGGAAARPRSVPKIIDMALEKGLRDGFAGKGVSFVWPASNDHQIGGWANLEGPLTHYGVMPVCASDIDGAVTVYSQRGPNLWVCAPSGKHSRDPAGIATLARNNRYRVDYDGTSASTPIVGGVVALVRAANADLTWRDVKLILAGSAQRRVSNGYTRGALKYRDDTSRYHHSLSNGFGVVDALAAVELAQSWELVPKMLTATVQSTSGRITIPDAPNVRRVESTVSFDDEIEFIEHVQVDADFLAASFRDLDVELVSPSGTVSMLSPSYSAGTYPLTGSYRFASARHLGERAEGEWTLRITDRRRGQSPAVLRGWSVTIRGHRLRPSAPTSAAASAGTSTYDVSWAPPTHAGASDVTGYEIRHIANAATDRSDGNWTVVSVPGGEAARSHSVTATESGSRDLQVRATNSDGAGAWSATATVTLNATNAAPSFSAAAVTREIAENTSSGANIGSPVAATDPDTGATLTYSLGGTHADNFTLSSTTGQLSTKSALDRESQAAYSVVVSVSDGLGPFGQTDTSSDDSVKVTIRVTDVDEPFTLTCTAEHPGTDQWELPEPEPFDLKALLTGECTTADPEHAAASWSLSGDDGELFEMNDDDELRFKKAPDYESPGDNDGDNAYEVTITAEVGAHTRSEDVVVAVTNVDEPPTVSGPSVIFISEGADTQTILGSYLGADPEDSTVTLSLASGDAADFVLSASGDLRLAATPDYEQPADADTNNIYQFDVVANDGSNKGRLLISVLVSDVDELPTLQTQSCGYSVAEGASARWSCSFSASDPEDRRLDWSLSGADAGSFVLTEELRRLSLRSEVTVDFETQSSYSVTVSVADSGPSSAVVSEDVTLTVTNVDESGSVKLDSTLPHVGTALSATLTDDDGPSAVSWKWQRRGTAWVDITGATSSSYTPVAGDIGQRLRVVVSYTDGPFGSKSVNSLRTQAVRAETPVNSAPTFPAASLACEVDENRRAGRLGSCMLAASDSDPGDRLEYRLDAGGGAVPFSVDALGRIASTRPLDFEAYQSWSFDLVASDGQDEASLPVTVTVNDVNETETVTYQGDLRVGETVSVSLDGGDCPGGVGCTVTQWRWERSSDGRAWTIIAAEQTGLLLLPAATECHWLRVRADYTDAHGAAQTTLRVGGVAIKVLPSTGEGCARRTPDDFTRRDPTDPTGPSGPTGGGPSGGGGGGGSGGGGDVEVVRLWGADRYATSLAVARQVAMLSGGRLEMVVLAGGHSWSDALVAGPLAGRLGAAVLLTSAGGLGDDAVAWLAEVGVSEVIAVGTVEQISDEALAALSDVDADIERIAGADRAAGSVAVARRIGWPGSLGPLLGRTVVVASNSVFADALAAGPLAAQKGLPILLVGADGLTPDAAAYLAAHADHVIVMGGTAAVSAEIEAQIRAIPQAGRGATAMAVTRLGGSDRYGTAARFARWLTSPPAADHVCFYTDRTGLATGLNPADAAASAPLLARQCAPLVLTRPDILSPVTQSYLRKTEHLTVFGGKNAIAHTTINNWNP